MAHLSHHPSPADTASPTLKPPAGVALITGAGKRLGREIALSMARAGWDVAVHYGRSADAAEQTATDIRDLGRRSAAFRCDLADAAAVTALLPAIEQRLGPVRAIVNSAAAFEYDDPAGFDPQQLQHHLGPNLVAPLLLARECHRLHQARALATGSAPGVIINVLDQKLGNLNPDFFSYTLTKAGLQAATHMMAQAFAPLLRVVAVSPGLTLVSGDQTADGFAQAHTRTPLGRSSRPEDIAAAVVYLACAPAITGTTLVVDGGQHLWPLQRDVMFLAT